MKTATRIVLGAFLSVLLGFSPASAEWYVGGYAGVAIPPDKDVDGSLSVPGVTLPFTAQDVTLDTKVAYGGKVGYFFDAMPYFGLEVEGYRYTPDASAQTVQGSLLGVPGTLSLNDIDLSVIGLGINAVYRLQLAKSDNAFPGGRFQPYVGAGLGIYFASIDSTLPFAPPNNLSVSDNATNVGFQALGGLKFFLIDHLALFAEYKYVYTGDFEFEDTVAGVTGKLETSLTSHLIYGGIAWHF